MCLIAILCAAAPLQAGEAVLSADFSVRTGTIRPLPGNSWAPLGRFKSDPINATARSEAVLGRFMTEFLTALRE